MNELILEQIKILFVFLITGLCIGVLFDFFRIQRRVFKIHDFITYIQDILFWIISGFLLIFVIMRYTNGEIRSYMILGTALGIALYWRYISKLFIKINSSILLFFKKIVNIFVIPFKKIHKKIKKN